MLWQSRVTSIEGLHFVDPHLEEHYKAFRVSAIQLKHVCEHFPSNPLCYRFEAWTFLFSP